MSQKKKNHFAKGPDTSPGISITSIHELLEREKIRKKKLQLGIFLLVVAILPLIGTWRYASVFGFLMVYPYALEQLLGLGLNQYLAKAIAVGVGAILWYAIFKLFFSLNRKKMERGFILLAFIFVAHSLAMYFITSSRIYDPQTGQVIKYCTYDKITNELQVFDQPIYDEFGQKARKCNKSQALEFVQKKRGIKTDTGMEKIREQSFAKAEQNQARWRNEGPKKKTSTQFHQPTETHSSSLKKEISNPMDSIVTFTIIITLLFTLVISGFIFMYLDHSEYDSKERNELTLKVLIVTLTVGGLMGGVGYCLVYATRLAILGYMTVIISLIVHSFFVWVFKDDLE